MKLKKGDKVRILTGKDKDKEAVIERVYINSDKVLLPGINIYKKHVKKNEQMPKGGVVELPRPMLASKVAIICPHCSKATRIGYRIEGTKKTRVCRRCHEVIG